MDGVGSVFLGLRNRFNPGASKARTDGYQAVLREDPQDHQKLVQDQQRPVQEDQSPENPEGSVSSKPVSQVTVPLPRHTLFHMQRIVDQFMLFLKAYKVNPDFHQTESAFLRQFSLFAKESSQNRQNIINLLWTQVNNLDDTGQGIVRDFITLLSLLKIETKDSSIS